MEVVRRPIRAWISSPPLACARPDLLWRRVAGWPILSGDDDTPRPAGSPGPLRAHPHREPARDAGDGRADPRLLGRAGTGPRAALAPRRERHPRAVGRDPGSGRRADGPAVRSLRRPADRRALAVGMERRRLRPVRPHLLPRGPPRRSGEPRRGRARRRHDGGARRRRQQGPARRQRARRPRRRAGGHAPLARADHPRRRGGAREPQPRRDRRRPPRSPRRRRHRSARTGPSRRTGPPW